jgi:CheY-like chemotaxis protein
MDRAMPTPLVLVVEPEPALRAALVSILRDAGHRALQARRAAEAQGVLGTVVPQAVLLGDLPEDAAVALVVAIRMVASPDARAVPIVALAAAPSLGERLLAAGATRVLPWPSGARALLDALAAALRARARYREEP